MQVTRHCAVTYRIYPDKAQAGLIDRTIGCARLVYNLMLETRIDTYNRTGKSCNPTPAQYKDEYPFLREVDSLALCNAQLNVAKAYNNFFRDPQACGLPEIQGEASQRMAVHDEQQQPQHPTHRRRQIPQTSQSGRDARPPAQDDSR